MKHKILYINTPTYTGGAEISLLSLMRHLDRALPIVAGHRRRKIRRSQWAKGIVSMSEPDRSLNVALFHNLPSGGAKRHTYEQVRELVQRGHCIASDGNGILPPKR